MVGCPRRDFQLKRIGKPPTVTGVRNDLIISKDVTRFGRHSENDYFLDSAEYLCLVSRWHAELHRVEQGGLTQYILRDNSLNGTFVNNTRVRGNHMLCVNDVVMFGHPNGKNIKPGDKIEPMESEFLFKFERLCPSPPPLPPVKDEFPVEETADIEAALTTSHDPLLAIPGSPLISPQPVNEASTRQSFSSQETPTGSNRSSSGVSRRILNEPVINETTLILKDISNTGIKNPPGLVHLDQLFNSHGTVSPGRIKPPTVGVGSKPGSSTDAEEEASVFAEAVHVAETFGASSEDSDEDIFKNIKPLPDHDADSQPSTRSSTQVSIANLTPILPSPVMKNPVPVMKNPTKSPPLHLFKPPPTETVTQSHLKSNIKDIFSGIANTNNQTKTSTAQANASHSKKTFEDRFLDITSSANPHRTTLAGSAFESGSAGKPGRGLKRTRSSVAEKTPPEPNAEGPKKRRRKGKRWTKVKKKNEEEEPDYHYDGDPCDSVDCKRPAGNKVSWVQCDDCDKWYHTVCVGIRYDMVADDNADFSCGCL